MNYDDSIRTVSRPPCPPKHPPMAAANRAAQFVPFAALTGLENALESASQSFLTTSKDMQNCYQKQEWACL